MLPNTIVSSPRKESYKASARKGRRLVLLTKGALLALASVPILQLILGVRENTLGPNPVETITHVTGDWTLRFLLLTLAISPVRRWTKVPALIQYRRMLGLLAFAYGALHLATWLWLDKGWDVHDMWDDIVKRRFVTAGMTSFLLMIPLAITSTSGWIRRLGGKQWRLLHRLVYVSAVAGVVHFVWLVKSDLRAPLLYGATLLVLFLARVFTHR